MATIDYEALIEKHPDRDAAAQRKRANKLAEIARNLETLAERAAEADEQAARRAPVVPAPGRERK